MEHIESFNLFGANVRQIPCIKGYGAPTTETKGAIGDLYMDTSNGKLYKCTLVVDGVHTWKIAEGGGGIYLGSGDMPEDYNVQIDPNGDALTIDDIADEIVDKISDVGAEHEGKFLRVVNGRATWETIVTAEGGEY